MSPDELINRSFETEFTYSATRSSGPGGQNVNKVNTRVELRFSVTRSLLLSDDEKELLIRKLKNKINSEGELILTAQNERTQTMNKRAVTEKFYSLLSKALTIERKRRPTRPSVLSVRKRLEKKRKLGIRKKLRRTNDNNPE